MKRKIIAERMCNFRVEGECWVWQGQRTFDGYGVLELPGYRKKGTRRRVVRAHRLAYSLRYGPIPDGVEVLHRCDNPPCVKPEHLFTGSQRDNVRDMVTKGRGNWAVGDRVGASRLAPSEVLRVRQLAASGISNRQISREIGVSHTAVGDILNHKTWRHLKCEASTR